MSAKTSILLGVSLFFGAALAASVEMLAKPIPMEEMAMVKIAPQGNFGGGFNPFSWLKREPSVLVSGNTPITQSTVVAGTGVAVVGTSAAVVGTSAAVAGTSAVVAGTSTAVAGSSILVATTTAVATAVIISSIKDKNESDIPISPSQR